MITHHSILKESHEKLKEGERRVLTYKLFENGKEIHQSSEFEGVIIIGYRPGSKGPGTHEIEPHAVGTDDAIFMILDNAGMWVADIAKGLKMLGKLIQSTLERVSKA